MNFCGFGFKGSQKRVTERVAERVKRVAEKGHRKGSQKGLKGSQKRGSDERKSRFRVLRSGRKMDSIRIVHVGRGSDERKHKFRALRSGKSGRIGNKRGSHL
jgi:hypothetical protein